jgi:hypothetical protein
VTGLAEWDVFVAHAGPDKTTARRFTVLLEQRGKRVCLDKQALQPGDNWFTKLPEFLAASTMTAALYSDHTATAHYEQDELIQAIDQMRSGEHRVVPIKLTPTAPTPYGLRPLQGIEAFDDLALIAAADVIVKLLDNPDSIRRLAKPVRNRVPLVPQWFTGREAILNELTAERTVLTQTTTVNGLGGVGKTTLAAAFARRYRATADIVWWVRAEQDSTLIDDLVGLAERLGIPQTRRPPQPGAHVGHRPRPT